MSSKKEYVDQFEPIIDAVMNFIDTSTQQEVEELALAGKDRATEVANLRSRISSVKLEIAKRRREEIQRRMLDQYRRPRPNISHLSHDDLRKIISEHVANDDLSLTMAARNEKGEIDENELRSIVQDILSLTNKDDQ